MDWLTARDSGGREQLELPDASRALTMTAVPRQSAPVSPPPMMMTCLPSAEMTGTSVAFALPVLQRQVVHREMDA